MNWTASKPTGKHLGTVELAQGSITAMGNDILSGTFRVDMGSVDNLDLEEDSRDKLVKHLLSADFFDVDRYPQAVFEIISASQIQDDPTVTHSLTGNLTVRDITKQNCHSCKRFLCKQQDVGRNPSIFH
ncbi:MAG: YceI family protein [Saprospiraceae bacterium]|nr:YceI family protein [Saprospiraceae bacterium]